MKTIENLIPYQQPKKVNRINTIYITSSGQILTSENTVRESSSNTGKIT